LSFNSDSKMRPERAPVKEKGRRENGPKVAPPSLKETVDSFRWARLTLRFCVPR
jgi:hypothetical protein